MSKLQEIVPVSIDPKLIFGLGGYLDPINRLEKYQAAFKKEPGSHLVRFIKWIGMALDASNYFMSERIGGIVAMPLVLLSDYVVAKNFIMLEEL